MPLFVKDADQPGDERAPVGQEVSRWSLYLHGDELAALAKGETEAFDVQLPTSITVHGGHMYVTVKRMPSELAERLATGGAPAPQA